MRINNYRMLAYTLIAVSLINWDYQRAKANILPIVLIALIPGIALLAVTFSTSLSRPLKGRGLAAALSLVSVAIIALQIVK
jgi:uncharacterized membrane protein YoaK (UPF0700 family)